MPLHIEELHSEVTALDGEVELTERQLQTLVRLVGERLRRQDKAAGGTGLTALRVRARPPIRVEE